MDRSRQIRRLSGIFAALACTAVAQSLPPEVILLARIKSQLRQELSRLPNYTCLETVSRFRRSAGAHGSSHKRLEPLDRVRLEIVYSDHREYYGSPGAREMSVDNPAAFIGSGMIGNGAFALTLNNILEGARFSYRGEELEAGRPVVRYEFHISKMLKALVITVPGGQGTVGEEGSILVDKSSLDLVRVESVATEIPPSLPLEEMTTDVSYASTRIGGHDVLLAQQADIYVLESSGLEDFDRLEFTHCRAYSAESEIRFDTSTGERREYAPPKASPVLPAARVSKSLPALLSVSVQLATPISDRDAVGTLIEGKVSGDVVRRGKVLIPDRSLVRGRIRRLERDDTGRAFIVGLEFTETEAHGETLPFYADLLRIDKNPQITPTLSERVFVRRAGGLQIEDNTITLPELPGVASFFIRGETFTIPAGFRAVWRTRGAIR
jgi:hypothetical protein